MDLETQAVEMLRLLGTSSDDEQREQYVLSVLRVVYQRGQIDAQGEIIIKRNLRFD